MKGITVMKIQKKATEKTFEEKTLNGVSLRVYESGFASLSWDVTGGTVVINGFIRESKKNGGHFFSFPAYKNGDKWSNNAYVIGDDISATIQRLVDTLTAE